MIHVIITSYGEPQATEHAVRSFLEQDIPQPYKILVSDPFPETPWMLEEKFPNHPNVEYFEDEDKGKSYALNTLFKKISTNSTNDIIIMTDGDVYVSNTAVREILKTFEDPRIGCVCGKPTSLNPRNNLFGYWSHASFDEMNNTRRELAQKKKFFEVSGYLFAIRNSIIDSFPTGASEDNVIPGLFWKKGYTIGYAEKAEVYVLNPTTFKQWLTQKKRNIKGHLALPHQVDMPARKNTILSEATRGLCFLFSHPKNAKEFIWFLLMALGRLTAWTLAFYETKIAKKQYKDGWREDENLTTTRPLD